MQARCREIMIVVKTISEESHSQSVGVMQTAGAVVSKELWAKQTNKAIRVFGTAAAHYLFAP